MSASTSSDTASGSVAARFAIARRVLSTAVGTVITAVFLAACVAAPLLHIGYSPVLTASMRPSFAPGDLLITVPRPVTSLSVGDVAVFTPPGESTPFAHRITALAGSPERPVLTTKGDANPAPDHWRATLDQDQVPVAVATVPYVGNALLWAQNPLQRGILIALFGLSVTATSVVWILRTPSQVSGQTRPAPSL
ncbi:signal peptidase I [Arthrobacter sp. AFG20]|uniref:signal peptidase I n=1 Tax=Arthrobacter sp. AFG20 TaxID=1688671 RepID=UPI000C9DEBB6|nr:signal peptidase I [Arthrobacter sp. AFG20]PNH85239.1 signal peptidase I [Arthrobacter sp. AFG20]